MKMVDHLPQITSSQVVDVHLTVAILGSSGKQTPVKLSRWLTLTGRTVSQTAPSTKNLVLHSRRDSHGMILFVRGHIVLFAKL